MQTKRAFRRLCDYTTNLGLWYNFSLIELDSKFEDRCITLPIVDRDLISPTDKSRLFLIRALAHELGHYFIASPTRRLKKDFGIPENKFNKNRDYWDLDEYKACVIENEILKKLGRPRRMGSINDVSAVFNARQTTLLKPKVQQWFKSEGKQLVAQIKIPR